MGVNYTFLPKDRTSNSNMSEALELSVISAVDETECTAVFDASRRQGSRPVVHRCAPKA